MKYTAGYKYQVAEIEELFIPYLADMEIKLPFLEVSFGKCKCLPGYAYDGPSGPAIDTKNFMRGSLWHDILYQLMRLELIPRTPEWREMADDLLRTLCLEDGMSKLRANWVYWAVQRFAARAAHPDNVRKVYTAP